MIQEVFRAEGLPLDLAYIPLIESAFKPNALSRAKAKGVWQFMSYTGRENGLRQDWYVDERSDPEKATVAAAKYLTTLAKMFDGDWHLAMASYNGGPGRVQRALKRGRVDDFWSLSAKRNLLPRETRDYVPMILAAVVIARNPAQYGFAVTPEPPLEYDTVTLPGRSTCATSPSGPSRRSTTSRRSTRNCAAGRRRCATRTTSFVCPRAPRTSSQMRLGRGSGRRSGLAELPHGQARRDAGDDCQEASRQPHGPGRGQLPEDQRACDGRPEPDHSAAADRVDGGPERSGRAGGGRAAARRDAVVPRRVPPSRRPLRRSQRVRRSREGRLSREARRHAGLDRARVQDQRRVDPHLERYLGLADQRRRASDDLHRPRPTEHCGAPVRSKSHRARMPAAAVSAIHSAPSPRNCWRAGRGTTCGHSCSRSRACSPACAAPPSSGSRPVPSTSKSTCASGCRWSRWWGCPMRAFAKAAIASGARSATPASRFRRIASRSTCRRPTCARRARRSTCRSRSASWPRREWSSVATCRTSSCSASSRSTAPFSRRAVCCRSPPRHGAHGATALLLPLANAGEAAWSPACAPAGVVARRSGATR